MSRPDPIFSFFTYLKDQKFFTRDNNKNIHYSWLITDIFWGEPANRPDNTITYYHRPTFKSSWRDLGSSADASYYK